MTARSDISSGMTLRGYTFLINLSTGYVHEQRHATPKCKIAHIRELYTCWLAVLPGVDTERAQSRVLEQLAHKIPRMMWPPSTRGIPNTPRPLRFCQHCHHWGDRDVRDALDG